MIELLQGVRVLECAILPTGDHTGRLLGDLGAEVLKVERPVDGDYLRDIPPTLKPHQGLFHLYANRNKRSISLNLRSDEGKEIFFELLKESDVFIDGFAGDACERLGIGYEVQREVKPDIIYCLSNGFGINSPYAQIPVHGYMMGALAGAATLEFAEDGLVHEVNPPIGPYFPGQIEAPLLGAVWAALTTIAAIRYRDATGKGVYIDGSAADAVLACRGSDSMIFWNADRFDDNHNPPPPARLDPRRRPKYTYYATKDGKCLMMAAIEEKFWQHFCHAADREDLIGMHEEGRVIDFQESGESHLAEELQKIFLTKDLDEWIRLAIERDIPLSPANQQEDLLKEPHFAQRETIHRSVHPDAGEFVAIGWPAMIKDQVFETYLPAPSLGEHTDVVLQRLGHSAADIEALRKSGVV